MELNIQNKLKSLQSSPPKIILKDFFKEKTNSKLYISALQKCILKDNNELIMNDLLNILFFYLKNGFSEIDIKPIKSFILNSNNINLKIQFNLRLFGILNFSVNAIDFPSF